MNEPIINHHLQGIIGDEDQDAFVRIGRARKFREDIEGLLEPELTLWDGPSSENLVILANALCVMAFFLGMEQGINEKLGRRLLVHQLIYGGPTL